MRERRDGKVEIIDLVATEEVGLAALLAKPRWPIVVVWYMRTLSAVWLAKGVFNWALMLNIYENRFGDFAMLPQPLQASVVFFACADLIAAVSLWLAAPWGGALWLITAAAEATTPLMGSRGSFINTYGAALNLILIAAYLALAWAASQRRY